MRGLGRRLGRVGGVGRSGLVLNTHRDASFMSGRGSGHQCQPAVVGKCSPRTSTVRRGQPLRGPGGRHPGSARRERAHRVGHGGLDLLRASRPRHSCPRARGSSPRAAPRGSGPAMTTLGVAVSRAACGHPRHDLALQALPVEAALPGDDEVGRAPPGRAKPTALEHLRHAADPPAAEEAEPVAEAAGSPRAGLACRVASAARSAGRVCLGQGAAARPRRTAPAPPRGPGRPRVRRPSAARTRPRRPAGRAGASRRRWRGRARPREAVAHGLQAAEPVVGEVGERQASPGQVLRRTRRRARPACRHPPSLVPLPPEAHDDALGALARAASSSWPTPQVLVTAGVALVGGEQVQPGRLRGLEVCRAAGRRRRPPAGSRRARRDRAGRRPWSRPGSAPRGAQAPSTSRKPGPPSDSGTQGQQVVRRGAGATRRRWPRAACWAVRVPVKQSGAMTTCTAGLYPRCRRQRVWLDLPSAGLPDCPQGAGGTASGPGRSPPVTSRRSRLRRRCCRRWRSSTPRQSPTSVSHRGRRPRAPAGTGADARLCRTPLTSGAALATLATLAPGALRPRLAARSLLAPRRGPAAAGGAPALLAGAARLREGHAAREAPLARGELAQQRVRGVDPRGRGLDAGLAGQVAHVGDLVVGHQGDDGAVGAGAGGAPGAVQVGLVLDRRVGVDDERRRRRRGCRGRRCRWPPGWWRRREWKASMLRVRAFWLEVAVQLDGGDARGVELPGQLLGAVLGAGEDHGAAGGRGRGRASTGRRSSRCTCSTWWAIVETGDWAESASWVTGLRQEALDEHVDAGVEGGGEQHPLAALRGVLLQHPAHAGQEAEVGHVVGLVEDGDLDRAEVDVALARSGPRGGRGRRRRCRRRGAGPVTCGFWPTPPKTVRRGQAEAAGPAAPARRRSGPTSSRVGARISARGRFGLARACRCCDRRATQRQQEGVGLAGAGAAAAEDVAAGERVGQRRGLDGGGGGDAGGGEDVGQRGGHAEMGEGGVRRHRWVLPDERAQKSVVLTNAEVKVVLPGASLGTGRGA